MCFSPYLGVGGRGEGLPRGLGHNLLMQFSGLGSSRMVVPLPSSRCLAEGNRILLKYCAVILIQISFTAIQLLGPAMAMETPVSLETWCPIFLNNTRGGDHRHSWLFPLCTMSYVKGR